MGEWINISDALTEQARRQPEATALILPTRQVGGQWQDRRFGYGELDEHVTRLAAGLLQHDVEAGTRVALMVPPSLEFFALFFALFRAGAVPVLIDPGIGLRPLRACLGEARPEVFIGVPRAHIARKLFGWARGHLRLTICVGPRGFAGLRYRDLAATGGGAFRKPDVGPDDAAAILFTSGSTGIPKGVVYRHRHFVAQVELVGSAYEMQPGEVDLPTFPPFALFDPALGMTTVVPKMDFTRPARVDPRMLVSMIRQYKVTNLFGSPALVNTLSRHLEQHDIRLPTLRRVLSAGAPVPPKVVERMLPALDELADVHTPYGATEGLPVATICGRELLAGCADRNRQGEGTCVGRPLEANRVRIIRIDDRPIERLEESVEAELGEIGEICVSGPTITDTYWQRDPQTRLAKMRDEDGCIWHRMGDLGWQDQEGRLWFCGRKSERVVTRSGTLHTECVEGVVNAVRGVFRSALVGVGVEGQQQPVVIVEAEAGQKSTALRDRVLRRLDDLETPVPIEQILMHRALPVDIRHNAKIRRNQLAVWASRKLGDLQS